MTVCVACVATQVDPPKDATTTVLGTDYCNDHGVNAWQTMTMSMPPGLMRRMMQTLPTSAPTQ